MKPVRNQTVSLLILAVVAGTGCSGSGSPEPQGASLPDINPGTASVAYSNEDETVQLTHLSAIRFDDLEGGSELRLFFSAQPTDGVVLIDFFGEDQIGEWVREGAQTIEDYKSLVQLTAPYADPESSYQGFIYPGTSFSAGGASAYSDFTLTATQVSGQLTIEALNGEIALEGSFEAPITVVKQVAPMVGAAIADSPQGQQVMKLMDALGSGDLDALSELMTAKTFAEIKEYTVDMSAEDIKELTSSLRTDPKELQAQFEDGRARLSVAGKSAMLAIVEEGDGFTSSTKTRLQWTDGEWLIAY